MCSARNRKKQEKNMVGFCKEEEEEKQEGSKVKKSYKLVSYDELPYYMKDNEFILRYYRAEWPLKHAFFSLFQWHNETINIWTHLLGFLVFVGLTIVNAAHVSQAVDLFGIFRTYPSGLLKNTTHDSTKLLMGDVVTHIDIAEQQDSTGATARWPFYIYLSGSMYCLLSSTICHLFSCHSHTASIYLLRIDYSGITAMIITSFFPAIYYIFQCQPLWQIIYLSGISIFGIFTIITLCSPALSSGKCRPFRAILFVSMGMFGIIPAVHACVLNWNNPRRNLTLVYESVMALSYLVGTGFYVSRVPERWRPGCFDIAGHSHQIFHVLVLLGALAHYGAALVFMEYRDLVGCSH